MGSWINDEIQAAKDRRAEANRKLERRKLDAEVLSAERPLIWQSLHDAASGAVDTFNSGNPGSAVAFSWSDNQMFAARGNEYPKREMRVNYRPSSNKADYCIMEQQDVASSRSPYLHGWINLRVDDNGHPILILDGQRAEIEDIIKHLLSPVFQLVT